MRNLIYLMISLCIAVSQEMYTYKGVIVDAESGEKLPGVNVYRDGSNEGTVTLINGEFTLISSVANPEVTISYIGYESQTRTLRKTMTIKLQQDVFVDDMVTVFAKGMSKGQYIIWNTIENYERRQSRLDGYQLDVYSKAFLKRNPTRRDTLINDSLIALGEEPRKRNYEPVLFETLKTVSYENAGRIKQVITKRNQGKFMPAMFNVVGVINYQHVFHDLFMEEQSPMTKAHFDDFYYKYNGKVLFHGDSVHTILATRLDSTTSFRFKFWITETFRLKRLELTQQPKRPSMRLQISPFIRIGRTKNVSVTQEYHELNGFTFPKNYVISRINDRSIIRLSEQYRDYVINADLSNVNFNERQFEIAPDVDDFVDSLWVQVRPQPLNALESRAYVAADSIYQAYDGFTRFMFDYGFNVVFFNYYLGDNKLTGIRDIYRFNPVIGHYFGIGIESPQVSSIPWVFRGGYSADRQRPFGRFDVRFAVSNDAELYTDVILRHEIEALPTLSSVLPTIGTFNALFAHEHKYKYRERSGVEFNLFRQATNDLKYGTVLRLQRVESLGNVSNFSFTNPNAVYRENIPVRSGTEHELGLFLNFSERYRFDLGVFKLNRLKPDGWNVDTEFTWGKFGDKIGFKRGKILAFKRNTLNRRFRWNINFEAEWSGARKSINDVIFPRVDAFFEESADFTITGLKIYESGAFELQSIGSSLEINKAFDWAYLEDLGELTVYGTAFRMDNEGRSSINGVEMLNTRMDFSFGAALRNTLLFIPLRYGVSYNTLTEQLYFKVGFGQRFDF